MIALKARFAAINRSADRRAWWTRRLLPFAVIFAIASWAAVAYVFFVP